MTPVTIHCDTGPTLQSGELQCFTRETDMATNGRETLALLRRELEFLDGGGYRHCPHSPWRAAYLFEESPSCPNFSDRSRPHECKDCWLMQFVPGELRDEQVPCRFVQLNANGVTVDSLYRCGTPAESEHALRHWLQERICELERELTAVQKLSMT